MTADMLFPDDRSAASATISEDDLYRYDLRRQWGPDPRYVAFLLLNPSTADGLVDDPTVRRGVGFTKAWGYHHMYFVNRYAWRATEPDELLRVGLDKATGPENFQVLARVLSGADLIVVAWGAHKAAAAPLPPMLTALLADAMCLGMTKSGAPKHPLYLPANAQLQPWPGHA